MIDYIREVFFNLKPANEVDNIFRETLEPEPLSLQKDECWFNNIKSDIVDDVSKGQRGYERNLEGMLTLLFNHIKKMNRG